MGLREAIWPSPPKPQYSSFPPLPHRRNPMSLSTLLHPISHICSPQYALPRPPAIPNLEDRDYELSRRTRDRDWVSVCSSDFSSPSSSPHTEFYGFGRYPIQPATSTSNHLPIPTHPMASTPISTYYSSQDDVGRRSSAVPRTNGRHRRERRRNSITQKKRHYCTFVHYATGRVCEKWKEGYSNEYDLARHATQEHGPEEVELIDRGELDFDRAQWIKSEQQFIKIKKLSGCLICGACWHVFSRLDALQRHQDSRACLREQERRRRKRLTGVTFHKKKGAKTAAHHKRR